MLRQPDCRFLRLEVQWKFRQCKALSIARHVGLICTSARAILLVLPAVMHILSEMSWLLQLRLADGNP